MAIEKVVEIKVISDQAKKNISDINSVIDEQRAILVLLEEEYLKAKKALDDYNASGKVNLAQEKALKKTLNERKDALTDQRLGLKKLAIEQRAANKEAKEFRKEQKETTNVVRGIDKLTGGFATKVVKLTKGFKSGVKGIKGFIGGLSGVKKALLATGIGALVVLVGTLVANFDKIKSALFGISKESKEAAQAAQDNADASQLQLENLEGSENILRAQGKSEKEIRDLKKQQTDETIKSLEAQLVAQKTIKDEQIKTAERNRTILTGILDFLLIPIKNITRGIDAIGKKFGKDFGLTDAVSGVSGSVAKTLFSGIDEEGDEAIKETEKILLRLKNKRAGFDVQEKKEKDDKKKKEANAEALRLQRELEQEKNRLDSIEQIREAFRQKQKDKEAETELEKLNLEEQRKLAELEKLNATEEQKLEVLTYYAGLRTDLEDKENKKKADLEKLRKKQILGDAQNTFSQIANLAGKDSKVGKALALASATISGVEGVQNAYTTAQKSPITTFFPGYPVVQAALAGAVAAKNIATIKSTDPTGGGSTSAPSVPAGGGSQAPSFNIVGASDTNQLADAVAGQTQQPVQAFVVANDVTTAQSLENNIVEGATL